MFKTRVTTEGIGAESKLMSMGCEVCEVKKALAAFGKSAKRVTWREVHCGYDNGRHGISEKKGCSYVLDVELVCPVF